MKRLIVLLFLLFFSSLAIISNYQQRIIIPAKADELENKLNEKREQIRQVETRLKEAQGKEKTLKTQLAYIDNQSKLTELKIEEAEFQITKLENEITDLSSRIDRLSTSVDSLSALLLERIVKTYKYGEFNTLDLFFSSNGFTDLLERLKYLQVVQANDKKVLYQLQATKSTFNDQKQDKETRQAQQEKLQKDLEKYQVDLAEQKKAKNELLIITKNDEAKFQALIGQLRAEEEAIARAISNIGIKIGPVKKGDVIAGMGSTGCSSGPHLHFEVFENAKVEGGRINGTRVNPHNYLDNGRLGTPLQGYPPGDTEITTEYGAWYDLGRHTGLDIARQGGGGLGRSVYAAESGIAYATQATVDPQWCKEGYRSSPVGKGVIVDHQNGIVTLYWHVL